MCLYCVLNISRFATPKEIQNLKARYKELALNYHPDRNHGNEQEAAEKFKEISAAYRTLSDPLQRSSYNATREYCGANARKFSKPPPPNPKMKENKKSNPRKMPQPRPAPPPSSAPSSSDEEPDDDDDPYDDDLYDDDYFSSEGYLVSGKRKDACRKVKTAANWKEMEEAKKRKRVNAEQARTKPKAAPKQTFPGKGL